MMTHRIRERGEPSRLRHSSSGMGWRGLLGSLALIALVAGAASGAAAQERRLAVPAPLEPWVPWVMYEHSDYSCAQLRPNAYTCGWPGELSVSVDESEGRFKLSVWLDRAGEVRLPGDDDRWPQRVTTGGSALVVGSDASGSPFVRLGAGAHTVEGSFSWSQVPEVLTVPPEIGRVDLVVRGERAATPRLDAEGRLWLQAGGEGGGAAETDSLRVSMHRRITDGVPLRVTNRMELNVGGRAREVVLGKVLLAGARPVALRGDLPSQVQSDGVVKIYVKPGTHVVELDTVVATRVESLEVPTVSGDFFDPQEVWVWQPDEGLRSVEVSGLPSVDPERTTLAPDWRTGTTLLAEAGEKLVLKETRRGELEPAPNALHLRRKLWLDLDGTGYTVRDTLSGEMHQGWRLNHTAEGVLGRASQGRDDLLITVDPSNGSRGVELRSAQLDLSSELRLEEAQRELAIVGWEHDVQSLSAEVSLPPGWELLGGEGIDQMSGTWFDSWTLFDFFFVLMVALTLGKLCGWRWTPLALVALCLAHGHDAAPQWVWLHLLASLALLRVLPDGWWRRLVLAWRGAALLFLVIVLVPFGRDQIRFALNPQVADPNNMVTSTIIQNNDDGVFYDQKQEEYNSPEAPAEAQMNLEQDISVLDELGSVSRSKGDWKRKDSANKSISKKKLGYRLQQVDPNAVVQTGPGLPSWSWRTWTLGWSGPVRQDHRITLWLLSPGWNRALTVARVALLIILGLLMLARRDMSWRKESDASSDAPRGPKPPGGAGPATVGAAAALLLVLGFSGVSSAQPQQQRDLPIGAPDQDILDELERRLLAERSCDGVCVVVSRVDFKVEGLKVTLQAEVHAQRDSAWFMPGPVDTLRLDEVRVDGQATRQLRREPGGLTAVRLAAGRHSVELTGTLVNRDVVTIQFDADTRPRLVTFASEDWGVDGIKSTGVPDNSLQLTRRAAGGEAGEGAELSAELPPWFRVTRRFALGLPWQVITEVERENTERPQLVKIPLVEGEKLITDGFRIEESKVLVDFPRGVQSVTWTSELDVTPELVISAAADQPWTEDWTVDCSRIWRCAFDGLVPVSSSSNGSSWLPLWKPWPGEQLKVAVERPEGAPGQAATVDNVRYTVTPGKRLLQAKVELSIRASQGSWQRLELPDGAELQELKIDGKAQTIRPEGSTLNIPVRPGAQLIELSWQQPWDRTFFEEMPKLSLGSSAVNGNMTIVLGEDRWLLWAVGPSWGPAVLFWSHLALLLIAAFLLSRIKNSPLKIWEWLLLAIGMAQLPVPLVLFPVAWFFILAWRKRAPLKTWWHFDLLQIGIVLLTLIAVGVSYGAIHTNLLFDVDMQVRGAGSSNGVLNWYVDQIDDVVPSGGILSLPLLVWRILMLLWALWLVSRLLKWAPWSWRAFSEGGLWRVIPASPHPQRPQSYGPPVGRPPLSGPPQGPQGPQGPQAPQAPQVPQAPQAPQVPVRPAPAAEAPAAEVPAAATAAPVVAVVSEAPEAPEAPEASEPRNEG